MNGVPVQGQCGYASGFQPLRQGQLDALCGVYALLNASRLADPTALPPRVCKLLFREGMDWLYGKKAFPEALYEGLSIGKLMGLHKAVFQTRLPALRLKRPFIRSPPANSKEFWSRLDAYTRQIGCGVIVGLESRSWGHWSVVAGIGPAKVILFDSDSRTFVLRGRCSCLHGETAGTGTGTHIEPGSILLVVNTRRKHDAPRKSTGGPTSDAPITLDPMGGKEFPPVCNQSSRTG